MDPLAAAIIGSLATAALAGSGALAGAHLQSRREHRRWLKERRYEAYVRAYTLLEEMRSLQREVSTLAEEVEADKAMATRAETLSPREVKEMRERMEGREGLYDRLIARVHETSERASDALVPMSLLGPRAVSEAAEAMLRDRDTTSDDEWQERADTLVVAARKALGIKAH